MSMNKFATAHGLDGQRLVAWWRRRFAAEEASARGGVFVPVVVAPSDEANKKTARRQRSRQGERGQRAPDDTVEATTD